MVELKSGDVTDKHKGRPPNKDWGSTGIAWKGWVGTSKGIASGARVWHELALKKYLLNEKQQEITARHSLHAHFQENI